MNLYSLHRQSNHWSDPETFRPERFLSEDGSKVKVDEWLQPFGYGKRKCLGENVARSTILVFLANILLKFSFAKIEGDELSTDPSGGLTIGPQKFRAKVTLRS